MCGGVIYTHENKDIKVYFPYPKAKLPVRLKSGSDLLIAWGMRKEQSKGYDIPLGGWARQESIDSGLWDKYFPKPVKIAVQEFMEKDINEKSHWFKVTPGKFLQGLLIEVKGQQFVYVVTTVPDDINAVHHRWPKIITSIS